MNICMYGHGGSDNHGCEAIVRSTSELLKEDSNSITLFSHRKDKDIQYKIDSVVSEIFQYHRYFKKYTIPYYINFVLWKIFYYNCFYYRYANRELLKRIEKGAMYLSIGGDNYCYGNYYKNLGYLNKKISKKASTVLWGVSIEPFLLENLEVIEDLHRYSMIIARESITFEALIKAGLADKTLLIPDPAFILPRQNKDMPYNWDKVIGINLSPLVEKLGVSGAIVEDNFKALIHYIINETDYCIALIPHVVESNNNDLEILRRLYITFKETDRIALVEDCNCMELKDVISKCHLFIGARTHASIAAYSSCIPTLVLGYSVKAKGIAKDLFGSYENYVIPVQELEKEDELIEAFKWLNAHEDAIREHLEKTMPIYCSRVLGLAEVVNRVKLERMVENNV